MKRDDLPLELSGTLELYNLARQSASRIGQERKPSRRDGLRAIRAAETPLDVVTVSSTRQVPFVHVWYYRDGLRVADVELGVN